MAGERSGGWQPVGRSRRRPRFYCKKSHYPLFNGLANIFPATAALALASLGFGNGFLQFFRLSLGRRDGGTGEGWNNGDAVCKCGAAVERWSDSFPHC